MSVITFGYPVRGREEKIDGKMTVQVFTPTSEFSFVLNSAISAGKTTQKPPLRVRTNIISSAALKREFERFTPVIHGSPEQA